MYRFSQLYRLRNHLSSLVKAMWICLQTGMIRESGLCRRQKDRTTDRCWTSVLGAYYRCSGQFSLATSTRAHQVQAGGYRLPSSPWCRTSVLIGSAAVRCRSSNETPWSPPLIDFQSSPRPPVVMCYCRRSVVCYCRPSTLEQSTC